MTFIVPNKIQIDPLAVQQRLHHIKSKSLTGHSHTAALRLTLGLIDLTSLGVNDDEAKITQLSNTALRPSESMPGLPIVAAVCIYPKYIPLAKSILKNSGILLATVAGGFPLGNTDTALKLSEVQKALNLGADEIDMVLNRDLLLRKEYNQVFNEIASIKQLCNKICLKVILETGAFHSLQQVRLASDLAMAAGADFIKTSTGKLPQGASMPAALVMLDAIKDHYLKTGKKVGIKLSGGITNAQTALQYLLLVKEIVGEDWLNKKLLRFGASSLLEDAVKQLEGNNN